MAHGILLGASQDDCIEEDDDMENVICEVQGLVRLLMTCRLAGSLHRTMGMVTEAAPQQNRRTGSCISLAISACGLKLQESDDDCWGRWSASGKEVGADLVHDGS